MLSERCMAMKKIVCVEDDTSIRELIMYTLEMTGYSADGFARSREFWDFLNAGSTDSRFPDLILLDVMLPDEDGVSILRRLKEQENTRDIPVIMLTAKNSEFDKVNALDLGADDYVTKPFGMMELMSRVRAVLRRCSRQEPPSLQLQDIVMNDLRHEVRLHGETVNLTLKEYELLRYFLQNPNIVLTRNQLLERLWGYDYAGESRTLDVHIATLRQKLKEAGEQIETVRGVGYRMRKS